MEGRPGDHPVTDMLSFNHPLVNPEIDNLFRELRKRYPLATVKRFWESEIYQCHWDQEDITAKLTRMIEES